MFATLRRIVAIALASTIAAAGCHDSVTPPDRPASTSKSVAPQLAADDGMRMRQALREQSDNAFANLVQEHNNIVIVGFRQESAPRGVNELGQSLVPADVVANRINAVRLMAREVIYEFRNIPAIAVQLPNANVALQLRRLPWVDYVQPNTRDMTPDQAEGGSAVCSALQTTQQVLSWNVARVRVNQAWSQATGTNGILLVLDDGIDIQDGFPHSYQEIVWTGAIGFSGQSSGPDDGSHGTLVLSVAAARNNSIGIVGVAHGAEAWYGDILPDGINLTWQSAAAQIIDAADSRTKVITISYSSKQSSLPPGFTALLDAIRNAYYQRGMIVVASTGNQSSSTIQSYPARWPEVIGVGGSGYNDEYVYNNYAEGNVEIAAPAVHNGVICKGGSTQGAASGTSFAAPMVAGAVMLLRQKYPTMSNDWVRARLQNTAVRMASSLQSGAGRLDVLAAVGTPPPPPPLPPFTAWISGPAEISPSAICSWVASANYGTEPYTYQWYRNSAPVSTTTGYTGGMDGASSFTLELHVNDAIGRLATSQITVTNTGFGECLAM